MADIPGGDFPVKVEDLRKSYGAGSGRLHALRSVSIAVRPGEHAAAPDGGSGLWQ